MINIDDYSEVFAGNGAVAGAIQVVASRVFWPGAVAYLSADTEQGIKVVISRAVDATHIQVKLHPDEGVTANGCTRNVDHIFPDLTAYTVAKNARITIPRQTLTWMPGGDVSKLPTYWA
jgi:hypothetical protein